MQNTGISENGNIGIVVNADATNAKIQDNNRVNKNKMFGILVADSATGTSIRGNHADNNNSDGIMVAAGATGTSIRGNHANNNNNDGIQVDSAKTTITDNEANSNVLGLGIRAVPGVTDGGGNRAKLNGDPAQCTNVKCT